VTNNDEVDATQIL